MMDNGQLKKGYKRTNVGVIPEEWDCPQLSEITDIIDGDRGVNYPCQSDFSHDGSCLFLNAGNVTKEGFKFFECAFINKEKDLSLSKGKLKRGDILLTTRGTVGNFAFFDETVEFEQIRINSGMVIVRIAKENLNNKYLYMLLRSRIVGTQIDRVVFGSAQPQLTVKVIKKFSIPIPSSQEQRAIATALSDVDALIATLDKLISKKRAIKTATMQQLLTGKKRLPGFNGDWKNFAIGDLFEITAGKDLVKIRYSDNKDENHPYPIYANSVFDSGLYGYSTFKEYEGDCITVSARGTLGVAFYRPNPFVAIGRLLVLKQKKAINNYFVSELINHRIEFASESTGVPQLTAPQIAKYHISLPDIDEQNEIALILSDMDTEITALESRRNKTYAIKQGMMQELLSGRTRLI